MNYQLLKQTNENLNTIIEEHMKQGAEKIDYLAEIVALQKKIEQDIMLASQDYRTLFAQIGKKYSLDISFCSNNNIMTVIFQTKSDFKPSFYIKIDSKSQLEDVLQQLTYQYKKIQTFNLNYNANLPIVDNVSLYHKKTNTFFMLSDISNEYLAFAKQLYFFINELAESFL